MARSTLGYLGRKPQNVTYESITLTITVADEGGICNAGGVFGRARLDSAVEEAIADSLCPKGEDGIRTRAQMPASVAEYATKSGENGRLKY